MCCHCDPFGIFCFIFLYSLLGYVDYAFVIYILPWESIRPLYLYLAIGGFQLILMFFAWAHLMCMCSDPGFVDKKSSVMDFNRIIGTGEPPPANIPRAKSTQRNYALDSEWTFCTTCYIYRPPRAQHCDVCDRCVLHMDHHCPWINNCVGSGNQKYFVQFTSYTSSVYILLCIFASFLLSTNNSPVKIIHIAVLIMLSVTFGIFAIAVLSDQLQSEANKSPTGVKPTTTEKRTSCHILRQICGSQSIILWLFPLPVAPKNNPEIDVEMRNIANFYSAL